MSGPRCKPGECRHDLVVHDASTYHNHGCRCADCRAAHATQTAKLQAQRAQRLRNGEVFPPHGTESTYLNYMCRCDECRAEHTRRERLRKSRRGIARVIVGIVLVAGSALGAFGHDARTSEPREAWLCTLDQPHCVAAMEADRG